MRAREFVLVVVVGLARVSGPAHGQAASDLPVQRLDVEARIGSLDDPTTALTAVAGGLLGPAGEIFLLQPMDRQVKVFSPAGERSRTIGRAGAGPGEFSAPMRLGWQGNNLAIVDRGTGRVAIFAPAGELVRDWRPPIGAFPGLGMTEVSPMPEAVLAGDLVLVNGRRAFGAGDGGQVPELFFTVDTLGNPAGAGFEVSRKNLRFAIRNPESPVLGYFGQQPFPDSPLLAVDPRGRFVVVVERSVEDAERSAERVPVRVHRLDPAGDTAWSTALSVGATPLPVGLRDSATNAIRERVARARGPGMSVRAKRKALDEQLYIPEVLPPIDEVVVDSEGYVWLRLWAIDGAASQSSWAVLDSRGSVLRRVTAPGRVSVLDSRHGLVLGVTHDELGVPYVVLLRPTNWPDSNME